MEIICNHEICRFSVFFLFSGIIILICAFADKGPPDALPGLELSLHIELFDRKNTNIKVLEFSANNENRFILFLPFACDRENLFVNFEYSSLSVAGKELISGEPTDELVEDDIFSVVTPQRTYSLQVISSDNLPSLHFETESGSLKSIH